MSNNALRVSLENIIPLTEARDHFSQIVNEVQKDKLYVLTKGGKPAVAIIDVKYLEQITGGNINSSHVETEIQKNPAKVGRVEMISHTEKPATPNSSPSPKPNLPISPPPPSTPVQPLVSPASAAPMPKPPTLSPTPLAPTFTPPPAFKPTPAPAPTPQITSTPPPSTPTPTPITPPVTAAPTPPPITPAIQPATTSKPSSLPPNSAPPLSSTPTPAATAQFSATTPQPLAPIKPGDNPKPVAMVDMHPIADIDDQEKDSATQSDNSSTSPDDKPNPAQYSADSANSEPDDMIID